MTGRQIILAVHVLTAVLGVGPLTALALVASRAAPNQRAAAKHLVVFSRLIQWALVLMLITGVLLLRAGGWVYLHALWLQFSFTLFILVGAGLGLTNRPLRRALEDPAPEHFSRVRRLAWLSCAAVAIIVLFMVIKPA